MCMPCVCGTILAGAAPQHSNPFSFDRSDHSHTRTTGQGMEGGGNMENMMPEMDGMNMSLLLSCSCKVGPLFVRAWTIESCGQYYVSLAVIALVCFLRHLLTMYKTRLILRLPEGAGGALACMSGIMTTVPPWNRRLLCSGWAACLLATCGTVARTMAYAPSTHTKTVGQHGAAGVHRGMLQAACCSSGGGPCSSSSSYGSTSTSEERRKLGRPRTAMSCRGRFLGGCIQKKLYRLTTTRMCAPTDGAAHVEQGVVGGGNGGGRTTPTPPRSRPISEDALSKLE